MSEKGSCSFSLATNGEIPAMVARNSHFFQGKGRHSGQSESLQGTVGMQEVPVSCCWPNTQKHCPDLL